MMRRVFREGRVIVVRFRGVRSFVRGGAVFVKPDGVPIGIGFG